MSLLKVRSRGYFSKQAKEASEASMYTERSVVRIDSEVQGFCIANPLELRKMGGVERCLNRMVPMPEVVVLNMMVPMVQASMLSREKRVQTANVVSVHSLSAEAASRLRAGTATRSMRQFATWYAASLRKSSSCAGTEDAKKSLSTLKLIPHLVNADEALNGSSIPRAVRNTMRRLNGKPMLCRGTVEVSHGTAADDDATAAPLRWLEIDVDMQQWSYMHRKALDATRALSPTMDLVIGWLLEGRREEDLPEQLLGTLRMSRINVSRRGMCAAPTRVVALLTLPSLFHHSSAHPPRSHSIHFVYQHRRQCRRLFLQNT